MNILEVGIARGREEGRNEGELLKLISQIRKKQKKGCFAVEIADALEEDEAYITHTLSFIEQYPDGTEEEWLEKLKK